MRVSATTNHLLRYQLWFGGAWVGLFVLTIVIAQTIARSTDGSHQLSLGGDFLPAYAAGTLVREGRSRDVYRPAAVEQIERRIVGEADLAPLPFYGPYLNPPFFAAFYAPLSAMPYRAAAIAWLMFNLDEFVYVR